jgi:hypothetical protein
MSLSRKLKEREKKIIASSQEWKCKMCDCILSAAYQIDHIIPFSIDGDDSISNLQALCPNCHSSKTQRESNRIHKFKKLCATINQSLCWFCLKDVSEAMIFHDCDYKLKEIVSIPLPVKKKKMNELDKFIHIEEGIAKLKITKDILHKKESSCSFVSENMDVEMKDESCQVNTTEDADVLKIQISVDYVAVNGYRSDSKDLSLQVIADAVNKATRNDRKKYSMIEIHILIGEELEEEVPEELFDFLYNELRDYLNCNIFIKPDDVKYTFIG